ncbi:hypothetical protein HHI36_000103 [Cryptolaemus montrouzieri]|uniref:Protein NEDD1 n=1 Tax=Cryptolaemus montrouzieri TaxID=559131 RepID=A0ABD2P3Z1_9CUCU
MYIASSSTTVKFHSYPDGDLVYNYQPGCKVDGPVRDISWSKDGSWLSLVPKSGLAEIISVRSQLKLIHTIIDLEEPSCTAFQNTTKKFIAYGTRNGQVLVYDIKSKNIKTRYPRASSLISHVKFTARDTHLVAGCLNGEILLYSNLTYGLSATYRIPKSESVSALRTNPSKRNYIIGGSNEGVVVVWDTNVNKHKFFVESHKAPVTGVAFSPINSDLIISTGADRQFCCYDIVSNKCIASVPVTNNMTGVDFSHDGTHFVMSSQDGNICLYDSRRILEPVLIFEGHKSAIKHVYFQKQEFSNSCNNFSEERIVSQCIAREKDEAENNESFGNFLKFHPAVGDVPDCEVSANPADSFMMAMGLDNGNVSEYGENGNPVSTSTNFGQGDHGCNQSSLHNDFVPQNSGYDEPEKERIIFEKPSVRQKQMSTSTPNTIAVAGSKLEAIMSPITNSVAEIQDKDETKLANLDQVKKMTEEIVKKEISDMFNTFTYQMKYQFTSSNAQMRRMYLDMQMSMVKEFIKMENSMNALREDLGSSTPISENYLLEENLKLKKQIALLEQQLADKSDNTYGNQ